MKKAGHSKPWLKTHPDMGPFLVYLAVGAIAFFPCLFLGNSYFDGDLLAQYVPAKMYLKACLAQGHFPLWSPLLFGGQPFFADPNTMAAYPFTYLLLPLPVTFGFTLFYFLHYLIAALGMYLWLKVLALKEEARLLGGVFYALSGFFGWEMIHPPLLAAFAWIPWWGAALEKLSERLRPAWAFTAGLAFALLFLAGNFQMTLGALYGGGFYLAFRLWNLREWRKEAGKDRRWVLSPLFFLWGALPLLLLWIPAQEFLGLSERVHASLDYDSFQADLSLNPLSLIGLIFPVRPFDPSTGQARPTTDYLVNAGFLGAWPLFLAALGLRRKRPAASFFGIMGFLALLTAFGKYFPLHRLLCLAAPGFAWMRAPFRYLFLFVISGCILAAFGWESLQENGGDKRNRGKIQIAVILYAVLLLFLAFWKGHEAWFQVPALLVGGIGLILLLKRKKDSEWGRKLVWVSVLLSLLPAFRFCAASRWGPSSNFDYQAKTPFLSSYQNIPGSSRILIGDHIPYPTQAGRRKVVLDLPPDSCYVLGLRDAMGYNPLVLDHFTDLYTLPSRTFARLMAVKAFVTGDPGWAMAGFSKQNRDGLVWGQNKGPVSFVYAPAKVDTALDDPERLNLMRRKDFDPYETAYFSEPLPDSIGAAGPFPKDNIQYELKDDEPDLEVFHVHTHHSGWVVFSEIMYPGWKAQVDGREAPLETANHVFRATWLDSGEHEVRFHYEPWWWRPLPAGLGIWFLSVLLLLSGPWRPWFWKQFQKN